MSDHHVPAPSPNPSPNAGNVRALSPVADAASHAECTCPSTVPSPFCPACNPNTYSLLYAKHRSDRAPVYGPSAFGYHTR
jgi:hypothetical protein